MAFAQIVQLLSQGGGARAYLQVYRAAAHARTGTLARPRPRPRPRPHTHTRTNDTNTDLPPSLGLVNGGFWVCAQHSATEREPDSLHTSPGWGALSVGVGQQCYLGQSMQLI